MDDPDFDFPDFPVEQVWVTVDVVRFGGFYYQFFVAGEGPFNVPDFVEALQTLPYFNCPN